MTETDGAVLRLGRARGRWVLLTTVLGSGLAMLLNAGLLVLGTALAVAFVRRPLAAEPETDEPETDEHRVHIETCAHCGVTGTQLHPADHDH